MIRQVGEGDGGAVIAVGAGRGGEGAEETCF